MNKHRAGSVCAAQNCRNKYYNSNKSFFRFPMDPDRARTWTINSHREDLLENVATLYKSHKMCSDHFLPEMFTNKFCKRLKYNAIPTIFPSLEGSSKDVPLDHSYSLPKLVKLEDEELPPNKICILDNVLLDPESKRADQTKSSNENLTVQEMDPLNLSDEEDVNLYCEENRNSIWFKMLSASASTQTSTKLLLNTPRKTKYRDTIRKLETENKNLKETVKILENKLEKLQTKITF